MKTSRKKKEGRRYEKVQRDGGEEDVGANSEEESRGEKITHQKSYDELATGDNDLQAGNSSVARRLLLLKERICSDVKTGYNEAKAFPKDIYIVFSLKFLESYSYFALSQILVLYLHEDFGVADVEAGMVYGMWGAAITLGGLLVSWWNDNLGVKKSLCIGFFISLLSSMIVATTTSKKFLYVTLFSLYPFGTAMGIPMLTVAVKRFTTQKNRGFAFGMYYSVMNMAALVSGPVVDGLYIGLKGRLQNGWSGYRIVIFTCGFSNLLSLVISARYLREMKIQVESDGTRKACSTGEGVVSPFHDEESGSSDDTHRVAEQCDVQSEVRVAVPYEPTKQHPWTTVKMLCQSKTFWRFAVLTLFLVNLHAIFRHLDATLPTYLVRCFGSSVPKGTIYSINPFMIIFLTPLVAACTSKFDHFDMIKWGGFVTAASPFFLAFETSLWAVVCMLVVLSLGEAIWSPRLYDYVMTVAPESREASFSALASAPLFAAKVPVGLMSGYLLSTYLPEEDEEGRTQRPQTMWLIIGLMTMTSPVLVALFDRCIREPGQKRDLEGERVIEVHGLDHSVKGELELELDVGSMNYVEEDE